jgi:hypothetical protein
MAADLWDQFDRLAEDFAGLRDPADPIWRPDARVIDSAVDEYTTSAEEWFREDS